MKEIAHAAGLGVGTLYRHFPDRQALREDIAADSLRRPLSAARTFTARPQPRWKVLLLIVQHCAGLPLALTKSLSETTSDRSEVLDGPAAALRLSGIATLQGAAGRRGPVRPVARLE
jgi:AcrR family transcriptional regulator